MKALICGVAGRDGSYLADLLLKKGYEVVGTSRDAKVASFANLDQLGIRISSAAPTKANEVLGWVAQNNVETVIGKMCTAVGDLNR